MASQATTLQTKTSSAENVPYLVTTQTNLHHRMTIPLQLLLKIQKMIYWVVEEATMAHKPVEMISVNLRALFLLSITHATRYGHLLV